MGRNDYSKEFLELLDSVQNKRARFVIDTILEKGICSTEDIKDAGYEHAPRAARDVRELGIPLDTIKVKDREGKSIAAYVFGDWEEAKKKNKLTKSSGRTQLTAKLKKALIERYGCRCYLYGEKYPDRLLQPDHRIPYEIGGDPEDMMDTDSFMLLCPSANRDKSWACEHCPNWVSKDVSFCKECYYAFPENYTHIAGDYEKHIELVFREEEIAIYDEIKKKAETIKSEPSDIIKRMIAYYQKIEEQKKMKCANCGEENPEWLHDEGDTIYCSRCCHRTRKDTGEDDVVLCPVCLHMRDRKALHCCWCNSPWGENDTFDQSAYEFANEFENSVTSKNIRYFKLKGRRK